MNENILKIETETFSKVSEMNKQKKQLKEKICECLKMDRKDFKLQNGNIILYGLNENDVWCRITRNLTEIPMYMNKGIFKRFKLVTNLIIKK